MGRVSARKVGMEGIVHCVSNMIFFLLKIDEIRVVNEKSIKNANR